MDAEDEALAQLDRGDERVQKLCERRWVARLTVGVDNVFDLRSVLEPVEGQAFADQLFFGTGDESKEPAWRLAKKRRCNGVVTPGFPPTLFIYENRLHGSARLGEVFQPPLILPSSDCPQNVLDFVSPYAL